MGIINSFVFRNWVKEKICQVHDAGEYSTNHPYTLLKMEAGASTVEFIKSDCPRAVACRTPRRLMDLAIDRVSLQEGLILEFGVYKGGSIGYMANKLVDKTVYGFDSFEGLPEGWANNDKGAFTVHGVLPKVPKNVRLCKGYFEDTIQDWGEKNKGDIAFLHVDCDLRSSTQTIFEALSDRIVPGTVILFDDYFNFPSWKEDGHAVFQDFIEKKKWNVSYLGYAFKELAVKID
jgi:predicted O-methyltransferase YrrM